MTTAYFTDYLAKQQALYQTIPIDTVTRWAAMLHQAWVDERQLFVFGNGGSAMNASHFVTDLGKSASDRMGKRFRCLCLNESISWITALGNDYAYEDVYAGQLQNYARPGDLVLALSVSGSSPNVVKAVEWANDHALTTLALVGGNGGKLADIATEHIRLPDTHFGRVEDAQMTICHLLCYCFIEGEVES
ncbi:SIS domain-containing protein [Fibrella sp. HMF5335]|uniref:SIS domain-containing protein n=1 Tax=Fibrella rubiginis TaxID=2817060 RepID=A0A939GLI2_9BACT|nr:SIS domain-containing protein [Fibrella rubiginis]MBO0939620.1 SIS domain-containing protein [Fibrella rubiginis]